MMLWELTPIMPRLLLKQQQSLERSGKFDDAHKLINLLIERDPTLIQAWMHRGYIYRSQDARKAALETFAAILKAFPGHVQIMVEMAIEYRALARPREAERLLRRRSTTTLCTLLH